MFGVPGGATGWENGAQSGVESRMSRLTTPRNGSDTAGHPTADGENHRAGGGGEGTTPHRVSRQERRGRVSARPAASGRRRERPATGRATRRVSPPGRRTAG